MPYFLSRDYLSYINSLGFFIYFLFLSDEAPTLETLDYTIRIDSTPTFLYFDLYLYSGYGAHYIYLFILSLLTVRQYELVSSFGTDTQEHTLGTAFIEIRFP